ncbi:MAG: cytochrome P450 [Acidimicrobiia bacterium]|jgi:cytochrome P450
MTTRPVTLEQLSADPHPLLHALRRASPVAWVPALDGWLVTSHELCKQVMLDSETFTVDDPRFSTQQVIGPSMLSLDGLEHRRHRDPFVPAFTASRIRGLEESASERAIRFVEDVRAGGAGDLRARVAAPLAVAMMAEILDLRGGQADELLDWYDAIVDAVHVVTAGGRVPESGRRAFDELRSVVLADSERSALLAPIASAGTMETDEIVSNVAVLLFGGIVTTDASISIAFRHLLEDPSRLEELQADRTLIATFTEETLRLEPSASAVDRYATRDIEIGGAPVTEGDLVRVSLSAANRDPDVFTNPDELDLARRRPGKSLTFARGPHACLGVHLARLEIDVAVRAVLDGLPGLRAGRLEPVAGLVFRAPRTVNAVWPGNGGVDN